MQAPSPGSPATHRRGGRVWLAMGLVWCALATTAALLQPPGPVDSALPVTRLERDLWEWWLLPVERNAFRRLPDVSGNLTSIAVDDDGQRWWLASDDGAAIETLDGGATWHPADRPGTSSMREVRFDATYRVGAVIRERGRVFVMDEQARRWSETGYGSSALAPSGTVQSVNRPPPRDAKAPPVQSLPVQASPAQTYQEGDGFRLLTVVRLDDAGRRAWALGKNGHLITSDDGALTWSPATRGALDALLSVDFSDDGERGWAYGASGTVLRTDDGGKTWRSQPAGIAAGLGVLRVSADGKKAWATGATGDSVLQTTNGGLLWEPADLAAPDAQAAMARARQPLRPPMPLPFGLRTGYIGADGLRGWAVGDGGMLLTTRDGGRTWTDPRVYARYPAPWYWLALLLSVPMFLRAWRLFTQARQVVAGMADTPATDAALTDPKQDRLNFEPLAAGISRFLRNPATEPPLTLAITGDWGSGKSSLMGLVCADLRKHGSRPIWFNAWHHQKEDHLFAALLGALSKQALPPWLSLDGIGFRLRLLWLRSRKHWVFTVLLCAAAALILTLHAGMNDPAAEAQMLRRVDQVLGSLAGQEPAKTAAAPTRTAAGPASDAASGTTPSAAPLPWAEWLALLTVAGTTLAALRKALTAFGADPAALLAGGLQGMKPKLAAEQNSFRTRFAEQFGEVSRALPERVVVVIDDLDRCRPEAVLEIMEAVNFLTSSGQCFVLFGMATDKVQAALAIAFERIAKELASASASDANANPEQAAREQRRAYAANYLQKLINLEIKVPTAQSYEAWRLLTDDPAMAASSSWRREAMQGLRRHAMWLALAGAIAGGVSLGVLLRPQLPLKAQAQDLATGPVLTAASAPEAAAVASAASAPRWVPTPGLGASDPTLAWGRSPAQSATRVLVQAGADSHADEWIAAGVLVVGAALAGLLLLRAASRRHREATDSKDFRDALKVWTELVRESAHTPRAVKRFGNKLRYFEMLQQGEARDRTLLDDLKARLRRFATRDDDAPSAANPPSAEPNRRIAAQQLVALGALHEAFGADWLSRFRSDLGHSRPGDFSTFSQYDDVRLIDDAERFIAKHELLFGTGWPPRPEEVEVFARLLDGIRMPGESEEVDMRGPSENSAAANAGPDSEPPSPSPSSSRPEMK
ncbi:P-loop NTPase fold protein [Roseateles noduli]|uniref:P-loop NTPase fold protein n=1 Tax=Roseateles noduli TaxID=2052484 RepID=UPI003D662E49